MAKKKAPAKKKASAKKKATNRKKVAKKAASRPAARAVVSLTAATAATTTRAQMVLIVAAATGHSAADVDGPPLSHWICNQSLQADIAAKTNGKWPELDPPFTQADVKCSDVVDDLTGRVNSRLP
jgi:hypothetical protein